MIIRDELDTLFIEKKAYINGNYVIARSGKVIEKKSSIDGSDLSGIAACEEEDINLAVAAAKSSYNSGVWSAASPACRKKVLLRLAELMEENRKELALLDTLETGRAFQNYYHDSIPKAIEAIRFFAESIDKQYDYAIPSRGNDSGFIVRVPLGVVGIITPWNDPLVVSAWKFAPALLMGNSVVIKPAEQSSLSILKVAQLTKEAGIPDGVFNVVPGYGETAGKALALHHGVRGIYFTGSSVVGKKMLQYSGLSNMKKVCLECGGKSPYIVTENCKDIAGAAFTLAANMFYNQGQICSAPSRVILVKKVVQKFMEHLKMECEKYVPGDPFETDNNVGCVVSREQFEKVQSYIDLARNEGADVYQARTVKEHSPHACCIQPTIITNISFNSRVVQDEIFGPVVVILEVDNVQEAIKIANDSDFGLAAAIWSDDLNEVHFVTRNLEAGLVHVNSYGRDDNTAPFGGVKESGIGKDKSTFAFAEFSEQKTIWMHFHGETC